MKLKTTLSLIGCLLSLPLQAVEIDKKHIDFIGSFSEGGQLKPFEMPHRNTVLDGFADTLSHNNQVTVAGKAYTWKPLSKINGLTLDGFQALRYTFATSRFTQGLLELKGSEKTTIYLNGVRVSDNNKLELAVPKGHHEVLIMTEQVPNWAELALDFKGTAEHDVLNPISTTTPKPLNAKQLFDAPTVSSVSISPSANYYAVTTTHYQDDNGNSAMSDTVIYDEQDKVIYRIQDQSASALIWSPNKHIVAFIRDKKLTLLDLDTLSETNLPHVFEQTSQWQFLDENTLIFGWSRSTDDKDSVTKHYRGLEDRWSYFRQNQQIYALDISSGLIRTITKGKVSTSIEDISKVRNSVLISRNPSDYAAPPHMISELSEVNLSTLEESKLGQFRTFNQAKYAKEGLYVVAGPDFYNGLGRTIDEGLLANNYDGQLYFLSFDGKSATPLSKEFDPAISTIHVTATGDAIVKVTEKDTQPLYRFERSKQRFIKLKTGFDVTDDFTVSSSRAPVILAAGSTATSPQRLVTLAIEKNRAKTLWDSMPLAYSNTRIAELDEFNFKNTDGVEIHGRVYLPTDLDKTKKYPALVYYYGGTSPVTRAFTGRYPFNYWAAQGYVVYVLQPTGATGFGQAFSAAHVNAWGEKTASDIIQGTQAFLKHYSFVDEKKVGNLGASYGGFMTMLLATKTDLFSASIAHAGISNITSYWGQGWWGYLYSGEASKNSFPWNNPTLYSNHSPVFHADKVKTPLLLIHGDADTNVPPGESHNMYTALKLLGQDVELVEFKGADHQIFARERRFKWWDTMLAYFDKQLKDEPQWWNKLYPEQ
ncbi:hypothetical protein PALB_12860 [Pseudoalteromonas luteoviolacea B = ATCC 29581]|nr:hypothetical protein PALB_12860 [Pseudoalteromonas luteoviolacea B = ATCC 29581]